MNDAMHNLSLVERTGQPRSLSYVLITPARNEAKFIEGTIQSVVKQTVLPLKWVIVSDGSTDGTDEIARKYSLSHKWIELVRVPERTERHFAGKVHAFNQGYERLRNVTYDLIGSLDADLRFDEEYFSFLIGKFLEDPLLGVGGTPFREDNYQYDYRFTSIEHVSGACQLFRRECFEEIGGYTPIKEGGVDLVAVTTARMKNWHTRTFTEKVLTHYRGIGTGHSSKLKSRFRFGKEDYYLGGHPVWEMFRTIYQMRHRPYVIGALALLAGYLSAYLSKTERPISREFVEFRRKEQMARLKKKFLSVPARLLRLARFTV